MLIPGITSNSFVGSSKNRPTQPELRPKSIYEGSIPGFGSLTFYPYSNDNNSSITSVEVTRSPDSMLAPDTVVYGNSTSISTFSAGSTLSSPNTSISSISSIYSSSSYSLNSVYVALYFNLAPFIESWTSASITFKDSVTNQTIYTYNITGLYGAYNSIAIPASKQNLINGISYTISGTVTTTHQSTLDYMNWYGIPARIDVNNVSITASFSNSFGTRTAMSLIPFDNPAFVQVGSNITYSVKTTNAEGSTQVTQIPVSVPSINSTFPINYSESQDNILSVILPATNSTAVSNPVIDNFTISMFRSSNGQVVQTSQSNIGTLYSVSGSFIENEQYGMTVLAETRDVIVRQTIPSGIRPNRWETFTPTAARSGSSTNVAVITIPPHSSGQVTYTVTSSIPLSNNTLTAGGNQTNFITVTGNFVHGQAYVFTVTATKPGKTNLVAATSPFIPNISEISGSGVQGLGTDSTYAYYLFRFSGNVTIVGSPLPADIVLVGGGGGGGTSWYSNGAGGGGGGAGGVITASVTIPVGNNPLVLGSGGPAIYSGTTASTGNNSTFLGYTANGGGWGGYTNSSSPNAAFAPGSGGSGGGAGGAFSGTTGPASGISGQGNSGGGSSDPYWSGNITRVPGGGGGGGKASSGSSGAGSPSNDNAGVGGKGGDGIVPFSSSVVSSAIRNFYNPSISGMAGVGGGGAGGSGKNWDYSNNNNWGSATQVAQNIGGSWGPSWSGDTYVNESYPTQYTGAGGFGNTFYNGGYPPSRFFNSSSAYYFVASGAQGGLYIRVLKNLVGL